eukprot:8393410-Lingulodinium_polyedra.AAC.1
MPWLEGVRSMPFGLAGTSPGRPGRAASGVQAESSGCGQASGYGVVARQGDTRAWLGSFPSRR